MRSEHKVMLPEEFVSEASEHISDLISRKTTKITILEDQVIPSVVMMSQSYFDKLNNTENYQANPSSNQHATFDKTSLSKEESMLLTIKERIAFFKDLSEEDIIHMAEDIKFLRPKVGEVIFEQGSHGREIYFVIKGIISISSLNHFDESTEIATLDQGQVFGEMAMINDSRSAKASVKSDEAFILQMRLIENPSCDDAVAYAKMYQNMLRALSSKLIGSNNQLISFIS